MNKKSLTLVIFFLLNNYANAANQQKNKPIEKLQNKVEKIQKHYQDVDEKLNGRGQENADSSRFIQPNSQRDPFAYTEKMYMNHPTGRPNQGNTSLTSNALLLATTTAFTADGLPIMKYRGYAESKSGEVVGILEILGMGVYTVHVGDKIGLNEIIKELVLTVEGLNRNNIIIKTGKLGKKLVIQ